MSNTSTARPGSKRWRWVALGTLGVAGVVGGWYGFRTNGLTRAQAQPGAALGQVGTAPAADYDRRIVAYLNETEAVTRDELAEYLIARRGPEKLDAMINRRLIDMACKAKNITVNSAAVEIELGESIKELNIGREHFVKEYLKEVHKNLFEWKEDVLRPKLMLTQLCRDRVHISEEEVRKSFEAKYGEKVDCRIIVWPLSEKNQAEAMYARLRDSEDEFATMAKKQFNSALASMGGRVKPIGRYTFSNPIIEDAIFKLQPGEVSELLMTNDGLTLIKCDRRLPPETTKSFDAVHDELAKAVFDRKLQMEIGAYVKTMRDNAAVKPAFEKLDHDKAGKEVVVADLEKMGHMLRSPGPAGQVLATIYGNVSITRQELGEYLIARYGAEALEMLINWKIVEKEARAKGVTVSDEEIKTAYEAELKRVNVDEKQFVKKFLLPNGKNLFEWKEDMLRPKLTMTKLVQKDLKITDEELRMAFDSRYGEKVKGRLILWKPEEMKFALTQYIQLRDSDDAFRAAAHQQFNPTLASQWGDVPAFARHTTGIPKLEEEAFKLQPGEVSSLLELPEGCALFKCDARIPPQSAVKLEEKRAELMPLVIEKKTEAMMPVLFSELRAKANPKPLIKDASKPEDLEASVRHDLAPSAQTTAPVRPALPPQLH